MIRKRVAPPEEAGLEMTTTRTSHATSRVPTLQQPGALHFGNVRATAMTRRSRQSRPPSCRLLQAAAVSNASSLPTSQLFLEATERVHLAAFAARPSSTHLSHYVRSVLLGEVAVRRLDDAVEELACNAGSRARRGTQEG